MLIHQDNSIAVFNKPSGVDSEDVNYFQQLLEYNQKLFVIHRLDKRVQGLIVFAKNAGAASLLSENFKNNIAVKNYHAIVAQAPNPLEGTLENFLTKNNKLQKAYIATASSKNAKFAKLSYTTIQQSIKYHLLKITLHTGKFHQIRVQLANINCPIVGDVKYGYKRTVPDGSIFLQASSLSFKHPQTNKLVEFSIPLPETWLKYGF
jgi:23S rRNA pseudouridine1911/1915/1917 synthase